MSASPRSSASFRRLPAAVVVGALATFPAGASRAQAEIQPDRPSFTVGIQTVPVGHIQVEAGTTLDFAGVEKNRDVGELRVRVPFARWGEVGLGLVTYGWLMGVSGEGGAQQGFEAPLVDAKLKLYESEATDFGIVTGAVVSIGSRAYREPHGQPYLVLALDQVFSNTVSLTANVGGAYRSASGEQFAQAAGGVSVTVVLSEEVSLYGEAFALSRTEPHGSAELAPGAGVTVFLSKRISVDARAGAILGRGGPEWYTGFGASFLF